MIRSMTGFGKASADVNGTELRIELKSVNNRYFKLSSRTPDVLNAHEIAIEKAVKTLLPRGTVNLNVRLGSGRASLTEYRISQDKLRQYMRELQAFADAEGLNERVTIDQVVRLSGVLESFDPVEDQKDAIVAAFFPALDAALKDILTSREAEGAGLADDLRQRCNTLLKLTATVQDRSPTVVVEYRDRLKERIAKLLEGREGLVREEDIAREAAMFADRSDISEEVQRMRSHCESMLSVIDGNEVEAGRRLEFIAQEMLREANTMGSKANDAALLEAVIQMKSEIEKIKEQVQNVE